MKKAKKFWTNPWTISIGSGVVVLLITMAIDLIKTKKLFSTLKVVFAHIGKSLSAVFNYELKVWWVLIGIVLIVLVLYFISKHLDAKNSEPPYIEYTEDAILGNNWRWSWEKGYSGYYISNLEMICDDCGTPLVFGYGLYGNYKCLRCGKSFSRANYSEKDVEMFIRDNVRRKYLSKE